MSVVLDSVAMSSTDGLGVVGRSGEMPIDELTAGEGVRSSGLDQSHVSLLMEMRGDWPPIVVWGERNLVVDGAHRVEAAQRLGQARVTAVRFYGTSDEAFVEAVRRNVDHGLPLSVADRQRAARRVLTQHPEWSDRRIASACGLSGKTMARLRRELTTPAEDTVGASVGIERRVGKDGRARPVRSGQLRERVERALKENPRGSWLATDDRRRRRHLSGDGTQRSRPFGWGSHLGGGSAARFGFRVNRNGTGESSLELGER
jgi:hypothetical protein